MATEPTERDREFISSFVDYAFLLATETCAELTGQESILEKLKLEGKKLVEAGKDVGLAGAAEKLVETVDDVVQQWALAPDADDIIRTKNGNSVYEVRDALDRFSSYFETKGLRLCVNDTVFDGAVVCDTILGEMEKIPMPAGLQLNLYTKLMISSLDEIAEVVERERIGKVSLTSGWMYDNEIYSLLETSLSVCESVRDGLQSALEENDFRKLQKLDWQPLFDKSKEDEATFKKKYVTVCLNNTFIHELHHTEVDKHGKNEDAKEAAAVLYDISRGAATFDGLSRLYDPSRIYFYGPEATKLALKYLGDEGYRESLWSDLKPGSPEVKKTALKIKGMADAALEKLEKDYGMPSHTEMEQKLNVNFDEVYQKIAETVERVAK